MGAAVNSFFPFFLKGWWDHHPKLTFVFFFSESLKGRSVPHWDFLEALKGRSLIN